MFYVQNWDSLFPINSAFQILQNQLVSIKKSLEYYDHSTGVKKDSYLLSELSKIQKLTYIINDNLDTLSSNSKDSEAANFLFSGDLKQLPALKDGLKVFQLLEKAVNSRVSKVDEELEVLSKNVTDAKYKQFLSKIKKNASGDATIYGSRCGIMALKVIDAYSKYINPIELQNIRSFEKLQLMETNNIKVLDTFNKGVEELRQEIAKDLRSGKHKLYYCILDNGHFKNVGGWQHPYYAGHSFVIEKTAKDEFRLYQSYVNQFSLKSFLAKELSEHPEGLKSYLEFYPFLKNLQVLSSAKKWDKEVNESYKNCFAVDHKAFLGEEIENAAFKLHYHSMEVLEDEYQTPKNVENLEEAPILSYLKNDIDWEAIKKSAAVGASLGVIVGVVGLALSSLSQKYFI